LGVRFAPNGSPVDELKMSQAMRRRVHGNRRSGDMAACPECT
jgi:hypothetical protein